MCTLICIGRGALSRWLYQLDVMTLKHNKNFFYLKKNLFRGDKKNLCIGSLESEIIESDRSTCACFFFRNYKNRPIQCADRITKRLLTSRLLNGSPMVPRLCVVSLHAAGAWYIHEEWPFFFGIALSVSLHEYWVVNHLHFGIPCKTDKIISWFPARFILSVDMPWEHWTQLCVHLQQRLVDCAADNIYTTN